MTRLNILFDLKRYDESGQYAREIVRLHPQFTPGQLLIAANQREKAYYEEAVASYNQVLSYNQENIYALVSLVKIELKWHNDPLGLELAQKAYALDDSKSSYHCCHSPGISLQWNEWGKGSAF